MFTQVRMCLYIGKLGRNITSTASQKTYFSIMPNNVLMNIPIRPSWLCLVGFRLVDEALLLDQLVGYWQLCLYA
jgi:hypothetical protein